MNTIDESMYDYLARLNIEGKRTIWAENRVKIECVYKKIKKYIKNARTACEVGFGEGYLLRLLHNSGLQVVGIDISEYLVKELRNKFDKEGLDIELFHGEISNIELQKDRFDLIFCLDVLEHIPRIEKALKNIKKALANGGLLIGTLPFHENLYENMVICPRCNYKFHRIGHHHSFNSVREIEQLLAPEFEILEIGEVFAFRKASDIIRYIITKISRRVFKNKITSTVYFIAKIHKSD
jgi:2-polyprenyl-3-methyl-5-hydroxy-6-metoxy-1,4-benzoquinol methylase